MNSPKPGSRLLLAFAVFLATTTSAAASDPLPADDPFAVPVGLELAPGLPPPTGLNAFPLSFDEASNEATVLLAWQPPENEASVTGYLVYRSVLVGAGAADASVPVGFVTETTFLDTVVGLGEDGMAVVHEYVVTATDGVFESPASTSTYSTGSSSSSGAGQSGSSGAGQSGSGPCADLVIEIPPSYGVDTKCVTRLAKPLPLMDCDFVPFRTALGDPC